VPASDYDAVLAQLAGRLGAKNLAHSVRVADTSAKLAALYGVDVSQARLAGLVHDWDRELGHERLVAAARDRGISVNPTELDSPYLLHARTGARAVREAFDDLPQTVIDAVEHHTIGSPEMSDLDMVIFVADMIEPKREFSAAQELRAAVGTVPLRELFARAYQRSVAHVIEKGKPLHPDTVAVWNSLVARWGR